MIERPRLVSALRAALRRSPVVVTVVPATALADGDPGIVLPRASRRSRP